MKTVCKNNNDNNNKTTTKNNQTNKTTTTKQTSDHILVFLFQFILLVFFQNVMLSFRLGKWLKLWICGYFGQFILNYFFTLILRLVLPHLHNLLLSFPFYVTYASTPFQNILSFFILKSLVLMVQLLRIFYTIVKMFQHWTSF